MTKRNDVLNRKSDSDLLNSIMALSREAGDCILDVYDTDFEVTCKSDNTPLTSADIAAHNCILTALGELTPDVPVLSEESTEIPFAERTCWDRYWLVDPLDGTREFVKRNGEFTVNIALIEHHEPVLGVVYAPVTGVTYYASRGNGAFKRMPDGETVGLKTRQKNPEKNIIASSRSPRSDSLAAFLKRIGKYEVITLGSSLKSCLVAEGRADIYPRLGPTSEWDTAAAQCVVEEAGGRITTTDMQTLRYNTKDSLLNPHFLVFGDATFDWSVFL
ncbi:MAG: 3'(2'),5'-bisphosphate nucleotidase CysQ [Gammaproteobacteria bacterium]|nr:3'(2'),5'-bisphosphate nucleotidase CysQ [Gammaproteobacteria bacterium]